MSTNVITADSAKRSSSDAIEMTLDEYQAACEAAHWRVVCPLCKNVSTPKEFKERGADPQRAAQECIGRLDNPMPKPKKGRKPCDWAAFGFFRIGGVNVTMPDGKIVAAFAPEGIA